jgi:acyl carrier protein
MNTTISKHDKIAAKIKTIIHDKLGVEEGKLVDTAAFGNDLGLDSLDVLETFMTLEKEFEIKISDEDAEKLTTVGSVIDYITQHTRRS